MHTSGSTFRVQTPGHAPHLKNVLKINELGQT
jgi:hypothetical protein